MRPCILSLLIFLAWFPTTAKAIDSSSIATEAVRKELVNCEKCVFFGVPTKNPLVRKHLLYLVSTLDRIPPPYWTVAVSNTGKPLILEPQKLEGWNELFANEKLVLKTPEEYEQLAKGFLDLAVGKALYIDRLMSSEISRIEAKGDKIASPSLENKAGKDARQLTFYSKGLANVLQRWILTVKPNGQIISAQVRNF